MKDKSTKASKQAAVTLQLRSFPLSLHTAAKVRAAQDNMSLAALVKAAIEQYLKVKFDSTGS